MGVTQLKMYGAYVQVKIPDTAKYHLSTSLQTELRELYPKGLFVAEGTCLTLTWPKLAPNFDEAVNRAHDLIDQLLVLLNLRYPNPIMTVTVTNQSVSQASQALPDELAVDHLVSQANIRSILGVTRQRVAQLMQASDFPEPITINGEPFWRLSSLAAYNGARSHRPGPVAGL